MNFSRSALFHMKTSLSKISCKWLSLETLSCTKNALKFVLLQSYFLDLFTKAQTWYRKPFKFGQGRLFLKDKVNSSQNMTVNN